jgi:hypothetical protein
MCRADPTPPWRVCRLRLACLARMIAEAGWRGAGFAPWQRTRSPLAFPQRGSMMMSTVLQDEARGANARQLWSEAAARGVVVTYPMGHTALHTGTWRPRATSSPGIWPRLPASPMPAITMRSATATNRRTLCRARR